MNESVWRGAIGLLSRADDSGTRARYLYVEGLGEDVEFEAWFTDDDEIKACRLDWNWELLKDDLPVHTIPIACFATGELLLARFLESGGLSDLLFWDLLGEDRLFDGDTTFVVAPNVPEFSIQLKFEVRYGRGKDVEKANKLAGLSRTPRGMTWHYKNGTEQMQLVPSDIHRATYFS